MTTTTAPTLPDGFPTPYSIRTPDGPPHGMYDKRRTYEWIFLLGDLPGMFDTGDEDNAIRLTIDHNSRKVYEAEAKVIRVHERGHREAFRFRSDGLPDEWPITTQPAARYGRKALDQFAAAVVADLDPDTFGEGSKVAALFAAIRAEQEAAAKVA